MKHHLKQLVALLLAILLTLSLAGVAEEATPNDEPVQVLDPNSITAEESSDSASVSALVR